MTYVQGFLLAVPEERKEEYRALAEQMWPYFKSHGAVSTMECWQDDVPEGDVTSFPTAVQRAPGEAVVFSWIVWPDAATYEAAFAAMMKDPQIENVQMPFDGKRMMWGGFTPIFEGS